MGTRYEESPRSRYAFEQYCLLGPGRSLAKLLEVLLKRRQTDGKVTVTTRLRTLETWSTRHDWPARAAAWDAEAERTRRHEYMRQIERQARDNARLCQDVGSGLLGVVALRLNQLVDRESGELTGTIPIRDIAPLVKAGCDLLAVAAGQAVFVPEDNLTQLEETLREADEETRATVLRGMKALLVWREKHGAH